MVDSISYRFDIINLNIVIKNQVMLKDHQLTIWILLCLKDYYIYESFLLAILPNNILQIGGDKTEVSNGASGIGSLGSYPTTTNHNI